MVFGKKKKETYNCPGCNVAVDNAHNAKFCQNCGFDLYNKLVQPVQNPIRENEAAINMQKPINKPSIPQYKEPEPEPESEPEQQVQMEIRECLTCRGYGYYGIPTQQKQ